MKYLSVCSGIEAASVAWHPLGWEPIGFSEIEPFPSAVLAHHYPHVTNFGDMTNYEQWQLPTGDLDLLVGGTPCQSFSVAGLRQGLKDPRGGLMLTYLGIVERLRPRWVLWENVPGVLSSGQGRDFGSLLGALGQLGYGWAYRVLDAQWVRTQRHPHAVPQRRRRVFVVGCFRDMRSAASVLFERESVQRDSSPRRAKGQVTSADAEGGATSCGWRDGGDTAGTLGRRGLRSHTELDGHGAYIPVPYRKAKRAQSSTDDESWVAAEQSNTINGWDVGERDTHAVATQLTVRRLTPRECERLQGFPDDWTLIPWRGKSADQCPDGPRYKALGNSMAVNCMEWIGERIAREAR